MAMQAKQKRKADKCLSFFWRSLIRQLTCFWQAAVQPIISCRIDVWICISCGMSEHVGTQRRVLSLITSVGLLRCSLYFISLSPQLLFTCQLSLKMIPFKSFSVSTSTSPDGLTTPAVVVVYSLELDCKAGSLLVTCALLHGKPRSDIFLASPSIRSPSFTIPDMWGWKTSSGRRLRSSQLAIFQND